MDISPDGKYIASVWNKGIKRFVTIKDLSKNNMPQVAFFGGIVERPSRVNWANNERLLVTLKVPVKINVFEKKMNEDGFNPHDYTMYTRTISVDQYGKNAVVLLGGLNRLKKNQIPPAKRVV
ncbi:hypothetical protein [Marinibactrum halimedae]|nr:hypothetical protein [Marinibactrum halimedae]MCD9460594.1 hypothetical protein [Marinibactrum halimedae]